MLDCERHRDRLYTNNIHHQAFHSASLFADLRPWQQDSNILDYPRRNTLQFPFLSRQLTRRNLAMHPEKQAVDAYRAWSLHQ